MTTKAMNEAISRINNYDHLRRVEKGAKGNKTRRRVPSATIPDPVSEKLSACETPAEMGKLAVDFGVDPGKVLSVADAAPNFGQFRMTIGNMVRAAARRAERADTETKKPAAKKASKKTARKTTAKKTARKTSASKNKAA